MSATDVGQRYAKRLIDWVRDRRPAMPGVGLLFAIVVFAILSSWRGTRLDGFTMDEPYHIDSGVFYAREGAFQLNPEQPPLVKEWTGLWMPSSFKTRDLGSLTDKVEERSFHEKAVFTDNDADAVQGRARAAMWTFHGLLVLVLGLLLWRVFGLVWAAGTLGFLALEPSFAANMPLVMHDLPVSLLLAITTLAAAVAISTWQWRWIVVTGVSAGLALGCKFDAPVPLIGIALVGIVGVVLVGRRDGVRKGLRSLGKLLAAGAIAFVMLWGLYGFRFHAAPDGTDPFNRTLEAKIDDLQDSSHRSLLHAVDAAHLLPRAYIWGQADTLFRTEGNMSIHFEWGNPNPGNVPLHFWPSIILVKLPLALLALSLLGMVCLRKSQYSNGGRWALAMIAGTTLLFGVALLVSKATYAGERIALPIVMVLAMCAGGAVARAWRERRAPLKVRAAWAGGVGALLLLAAVTELREPRLWEYHNEIVGGTSEAFRSFKNEGLDIGQRGNEIRQFYQDEIAATGLPLHDDYGLMDSEGRRMPHYRLFVEDIHDTNVDGVFDGYFVYGIHRTLPTKPFGLDPAIWKGLTEVRRLGNATIWKGRVVAPLLRAKQTYERVRENAFGTENPDWKTIRQRMEEVVPVLPSPWAQSAQIILGNACQKLGDRDAAIKAFEGSLKVTTEGDPRIASITHHLERLRAGEDLQQLPLVRDPSLE